VNVRRRFACCGFSLLELLLTLTVLAIVSSYAVAAWREHIKKVRRSEAITLLMQLTARQEQFRLQAMRYADGIELSAPPPTGLGISATGENYRLASVATDTTFTATATVQYGGQQADDAHCWLFGVDSSGRRWAENRSGRDTSDHCWQR
jgi:type IV pilus assembly protein PilE